MRQAGLWYTSSQYCNTVQFTANCRYLQVTDQSVSYYTFVMLIVCFQPIRKLLPFCTVDSLPFNQSESYYTSFTVDSLLFNQSESYYTFCTVAQPISELLHLFFYCLHVQEEHMLHYFAFIALLLMTMDCDIVIMISLCWPCRSGCWCGNFITHFHWHHYSCLCCSTKRPSTADSR